MKNRNTSNVWKNILHVTGISLLIFSTVVFVMDPFSALKKRQFRKVQFIEKSTDPLATFLLGGTMITIKTKSGQIERVNFMSDDLNEMESGSIVFIMSADVYKKGPDEQRVTFWRVFKAYALYFGGIYPLWLIFTVVKKWEKRHNQSSEPT